MEKKSGMCPLGDESPPLLSRSEATPPVSLPPCNTRTSCRHKYERHTTAHTWSRGLPYSKRRGNNQPGEDDIQRTKQPVSEKVVYQIGRGLLCTDYRLWSPTMTWEPPTLIRCKPVGLKWKIIAPIRMTTAN